LAAAYISPAQILARPGWKNSPVSSDLWWKHAVFYDVSAESFDHRALATRLDALRSLHVDALIVPAPELPPPGSNGPMPNLDDFDDLLRQSSAHGIRVLLTLHAPTASADLSGLARFWLNRGVAGLHIVSPPGATPEQTQAMADSVRKLAAAAAGQRIILSDLTLPSQDAAATNRPQRVRTSQRPSSSQLQIDTRATNLATFDAATLRPILSQAITQPNLLVDMRAPASASLAEAVATMTLITQPATLIDSAANLVLQPTVDQPQVADEPAKPASPPPIPPQAPPGTYFPYTPYIPPPRPHVAAPPKPIPEDPLTTWYRQLASLHHDNPVLRSGSTTFLDFDAQNALVWVSKPAPNAPRLTAPVVVICNLSSSPLQLSLADATKHLDLHGFFLRTLLRTDHAMGAQDLNSVNVPAYGVYVGELHR
jgi:alpha-glucosidase